MTYRNWGRTVAFSPAVFLKPRREGEIIRLIQRAAAERRKVRVVGAGHSWTPLIETPDYLLSLDKLQGIISFSPTDNLATLWAGTRLYRALPRLWKLGFSLANQGDIDRQSLAGAFSTSTHGTGRTFGILATQVLHYRFISGKGELYDVYPDQQPDLFRCLQVSLGLLGILTQITLRLQPRYYLHLLKKREPLEEVLTKSEEYLSTYRHFEFFWFPYSEWAFVKLISETSEEKETSLWKRWAVDVVWENGAFWLLNKAAQWRPGQSARLCRFAGENTSQEERIDRAYRIFASPRWVRFREMEYSVPAAAGPEVLREIRRWIAKHQPAVSFPIEYRYVKGDNIPLSPAYGEDRVFIAVHMYHRMPHQEYFAGIERVFQAYQGRPHWGKLHTANAAYLHAVYPELGHFLRLRQVYDPEGVFLTPHLEQCLLGERVYSSAVAAKPM
ncbi:MAG: D-arabinono-1,4-lactone oxidase [Bacteroidia bacterium]|nr:D-arabinono-1,4-lactone oxidase [Bacteroidia bacterium]